MSKEKEIVQLYNRFDNHAVEIIKLKSKLDRMNEKFQNISNVAFTAEKKAADAYRLAATSANAESVSSLKHRLDAMEKLILKQNAKKPSRLVKLKNHVVSTFHFFVDGL